MTARLAKHDERNINIKYEERVCLTAPGKASASLSLQLRAFTPA